MRPNYIFYTYGLPAKSNRKSRKLFPFHKMAKTLGDGPKHLKLITHNTNDKCANTKIVFYYFRKINVRHGIVVNTNNQLLQLCTARTAWSESDQAVRAVHSCNSW